MSPIQDVNPYARLMIIPLARKAGEPPEPLSSQPLGNYAGH